MFCQQIINCIFSKWFPLFSQITIESDFIKLSDDFIDYLLSDGIVLPKTDDHNYERSGQLTDWSDESDSEENTESDIEFPELENKIQEIIRNLGPVFPKLNWSSCEDSKWMSASGTRCIHSSDVYLLLKSSDRIVHDLTQPFKYCLDVNEENTPKVDYELVLKKWIDINPSMEFRCFIKNNDLIGITQRDVRSYYSHIEQQKNDIIQDIQRFFTTHLKNKFFDSDFVIDVYRPNSGRVVLIDINPFGQTTDSLLFDWEQLNGQQTDLDFDEEMPEFRYLTSQTGIQSSAHSLNSLPIDVSYGYNLNDFMNGCHIDR